MKISKNKKMCFFLMAQGSLNPKIRFLGQKMCPVAWLRTDGHTDRVTTVGSLSGFQDFILQPIIKDRPNKHKAEWQRKPLPSYECFPIMTNPHLI